VLEAERGGLLGRAGDAEVAGNSKWLLMFLSRKRWTLTALSGCLGDGGAMTSVLRIGEPLCRSAVALLRWRRAMPRKLQSAALFAETGTELLRLVLARPGDAPLVEALRVLGTLPPACRECGEPLPTRCGVSRQRAGRALLLRAQDSSSGEEGCVRAPLRTSKPYSALTARLERLPPVSGRVSCLLLPRRMKPYSVLDGSLCGLGCLEPVLEPPCEGSRTARLQVKPYSASAGGTAGLAPAACRQASAGPRKLRTSSGLRVLLPCGRRGVVRPALPPRTWFMALESSGCT